jgi:hypothetical protein
MMFADRPLADLRMIIYAHIEIQKNVFVEGRFCVDCMSFVWKSESNGDQVTKLSFYRHKYPF